jgi:type II secretory pathway pseudopilin PulG
MQEFKGSDRHPSPYNILRHYQRQQPILKLVRANLQHCANNCGLSLVEVVAGMLIAGTFVAVALQAMVVAKSFQAKGTEFNQANNWIQQDLESVKQQAALYQSTTLANAVAGGSNTLAVGWANGFATGNRIRVGTDPTTYQISAVNATATPKTLTITPTLSTPQPAGTRVSTTDRCTATSSGLGFAQGLRSALSPVNPDTRDILGGRFTLNRGGYAGATYPSIRNAAPYYILELSYQVLPQGGGTPIAQLATEVIPDAALHCP